MAMIGRPVTANERNYQNVAIAPKSAPGNREPTAAEKERLINKVTGFRPKNDLYVDGDSHNKMGKDEFLKLLTHQLQHQDPMKPMEQGQMAAELAQFSQLEQLANLNTKFEAFNKNANVEDKFYGASFLGKEVVTTGRSLEFKGEGTEADILFTLPKAASKALVRIYDNNNNMVGEMWKENLGRGNQNVFWDGTALDGSPSAAGEYSVSVLAWDENSDPIEVATKVKGSVESVFFENGETVLMVDGKKVFLRDVDSFHVPGKAPAIEEAKNIPTNLPIVEKAQTQVKLNNQAPAEAYKANSRPVGTGITNVYDVE